MPELIILMLGMYYDTWGHLNSVLNEWLISVILTLQPQKF
jgi:hypothetical protein